jgi:Family of unknown function (DUF5984)
MLFDFSLYPIEEVNTWGESPNLKLSWFGFTEGFYRLQVGSEFLLNYSSELVNRRTEQFPNEYSGSFAEYYVVRLWEDILNMLPDVFEPLPSELSSLFEENQTVWFSWESNALNWLDKQPDEDEVLDIFELVSSWQNARRLDAGYLKHAPKIWIWSTPKSVIISWDNTDITWEGIQVWSAMQGHYHMDRGEFLDEVRAFHNKLMLEMDERVEIVCNQWHRPEIHVDTQYLRQEQKDRATWLDKALRRHSFSP